MLSYLEQAKRYKKCRTYDGHSWRSNCKRIYVLHMTPNNNGEVIFATHQEKIDQRRQVLLTGLPQNIEFPLFYTLIEISEKISSFPTPLKCPVWNPIPRPFSKEIRGREKTMWDTANFRALRPEWAQPFMTTSTLIFFNQFLISMNLYQHAKNQVFLSFCSGNVWFKNPAFLLTGHEHFGLYLRNQNIHKYEICSSI